MFIYSLKHLQRYKYEKHVQEYDMKLKKDTLHKGTVIGQFRQLLDMAVTVIGHLNIFGNIVKSIYTFLLLWCSEIRAPFFTCVYI
jgi:hypothetical protein